MAAHLITIQNCRVANGLRVLLPRVDWQMDAGEAWLVTGPNGGGKEAFVRALGGQLAFEPNAADADGAQPLYASRFGASVAVVSLEAAARLIQEERERDESEILNREDAGRTGRRYIAEVLGGPARTGAPLPPEASRLEALPQVRLCGVERILDRGLRYMSTGEIRRTLLCRALLSGCRLLVLSDPFAGLDAQSRGILLEFFNTIARRQRDGTGGTEAGSQPFPRIILSMERFHEVPDAINRVIEFNGRKVTSCGSRTDYEALLARREQEERGRRAAGREAFLGALRSIREASGALTDDINSTPVPDPLIRFEDVNVGWDGRLVLAGLNWEVRKGGHWLIRGPNGSGKTTLLELVTGDNMQVFREKVFLFGRRRGSGETIWDIRRQLGIVSYRLHVEYRMVGGTTLLDVITSGFHDSIGLYGEATDFEAATARQWLQLAGFGGREGETFGGLSYGEQRAVLIIRAAVKSPRVLILDEPCHGLDDAYRTKVLDLLETVAETGTTTLLHVTHDPAEALPCERHILELCPGQTPMYRILDGE